MLKNANMMIIRADDFLSIKLVVWKMDEINEINWEKKQIWKICLNIYDLYRIVRPILLFLHFSYFSTFIFSSNHTMLLFPFDPAIRFLYYQMHYSDWRIIWYNFVNYFATTIMERHHFFLYNWISELETVAN